MFEWVGPNCPKELAQDVQSGPKRLCPKASLTQDVRIPFQNLDVFVGKEILFKIWDWFETQPS